jgi:hypothetical protein
MDERDEVFENLIERSSLGTSGARQLRRRTPRSQVDAVRRIVDLRNQMVHSSDGQAAQALIQLLRDLGYHGQAEQVLAEAFPGREADSVVHMAQVIDRGADRRRNERQVIDLTGEEPTSAADAESLWTWLREEPELRGHLHRADRVPHPDSSRALVVAVATTAAAAGVVAAAAASPAAVVVAASAVLPALAHGLVTWLRTRRSDVTITLMGPDGRQVSLDAKKVNDPENALRQVLGDQAT